LPDGGSRDRISGKKEKGKRLKLKIGYAIIRAINWDLRGKIYD